MSSRKPFPKTWTFRTVKQTNKHNTNKADLIFGNICMALTEEGEEMCGQDMAFVWDSYQIP